MTKKPQTAVDYDWMDDDNKCGFCYDQEHGKNGEIKREWSDEWKMYINVCRKHAGEQTGRNPKKK